MLGKYTSLVRPMEIHHRQVFPSSHAFCGSHPLGAVGGGMMIQLESH